MIATKSTAVLDVDLATARALAAKITIPQGPATPAGWGTCPVCRQSATSMYLGRLSCTRCGWPKKPGRTTF